LIEIKDYTKLKLLELLLQEKRCQEHLSWQSVNRDHYKKK